MKMSTLPAISHARRAARTWRTPRRRPDPSAAPVRTAPAPTNTAMSPEPGQDAGGRLRAPRCAPISRGPGRADGTIPPFGNPDPYGPGRWGPGIAAAISVEPPTIPRKRVHWIVASTNPVTEMARAAFTRRQRDPSSDVRTCRAM